MLYTWQEFRQQQQPAYIHQSTYQPTKYAHKNQLRHSDHGLASIWISDSVLPPGKLAPVFISDSMPPPGELAPVFISDSVPPPGKMVSVDFGRYNIRNTRIDYQPTPTPISNPAPTTSKMTAMDVGRLNIRNWRNDNQQAPTPISNQVPNSFTSEIRKDCESIPEFSTELAPPAQIFSAQAPPTNAPLTQVLPAEQATPTKKTVNPDKDVTSEEVPSNTQETVTPDKDVTSEEVLSSTQFFNSGFVNEIKDPCIEKAHEKSCLVVQARNDNKNLALTQSPKLQRAHIQSTSDFHRNFYIRPAPEQILLLGTPSDGIVKVIKPLHDVPETSANCFAIYHPHYKKKREMTESAHKPFLLRPPPKLTESAHNHSLLRSPQKLLSLPGASSDCVVKFVPQHPHYKEKPGMEEAAHDPFLRLLFKLISLLGASSHYIIEVMNPLHDMPNMGKHWFAIYHPHYKDEQVSNPTRTSVCAANCLYIGYSLGNLSTASPFARDGGACATELGLVTKKGEPPRTALDLSHPLQSPSLLFSLTIFECALISGW